MQLNLPSKKTFLIGALLLLILLGLAAIIVLVISPRQQPQQGPTAATESSSPPNQKVVVKSSDPTQALPYLPADFPLDKNAVVANNYVTTSPKQTDIQQYTRTYSSKRTLSDLYNMYLTYLTQNKWDIRNKTLAQQVALVNATKDKVAVSITLQDLGGTRMIVLNVGQSADSFVPITPTASGSTQPSR